MQRTTLGVLAVFMMLTGWLTEAIQQSTNEREALKNARILDITGITHDIKGIALDVDRVLKDLNATVTDREIAIALSADVLFDFDKATLKPAAEQSLQLLLTVVNSQSSGAVSVVGHTDTQGDEAYNNSLSLRRANAVKAWLVTHGVPASRVAATGAGESRPIKPGDTEDAHRANRRVEIRIAKPST